MREFRDVLDSSSVAALVNEAIEARQRWWADASRDRTWYEKMTRMQSWEFAQQQAPALLASVP